MFNFALGTNPLSKAQEKLHDLLDWAYRDKLIGGDSFQPVWSCKFCTGRLAQDSSGAWFHLTKGELR